MPEEFGDSFGFGRNDLRSILALTEFLGCLVKKSYLTRSLLLEELGACHKVSNRLEFNGLALPT